MWLCLISVRSVEETFENAQSRKVTNATKCDLAFSCLNYFKKQLGLHSGEEPNKCEECDNAFICTKLYEETHVITCLRYIVKWKWPYISSKTSGNHKKSTINCVQIQGVFF